MFTDIVFFFFWQKTAYEMRISDWSSDVCSSDLSDAAVVIDPVPAQAQRQLAGRGQGHDRAGCIDQRGGVGVGNAVRSYLEGKTATIATLKCLGAPGRQIGRAA